MIKDHQDFTTQQLNKLLSLLDIPDMRRDTSNLSNLRWLQRNVNIRNGDADNAAAIHLLIRTLMRRKTTR